MYVTIAHEGKSWSFIDLLDYNPFYFQTLSSTSFPLASSVAERSMTQKCFVYIYVYVYRFIYIHTRIYTNTHFLKITLIVDCNPFLLRKEPWCWVEVGHQMHRTRLHPEPDHP